MRNMTMPPCVHTCLSGDMCVCALMHVAGWLAGRTYAPALSASVVEYLPLLPTALTSVPTIRKLACCGSTKTGRGGCVRPNRLSPHMDGWGGHQQMKEQEERGAWSGAAVCVFVHVVCNTARRVGR